MKRIFDSHGTHFEFEDSTGATQFKPNTCKCIMIYDKDSKFLATVNRCRIHQTKEKQAWMDGIVEHNKENQTRE